MNQATVLPNHRDQAPPPSGHTLDELLQETRVTPEDKRTYGNYTNGIEHRPPAAEE